MNPIETFVAFVGTTGTGSLLVLGFLKVTILLGLALLVRTLLSRAHPDRRHLLLRMALAIAVLLPLLSFRAYRHSNLHLFGTLLSCYGNQHPNFGHCNR